MIRSVRLPVAVLGGLVASLFLLSRPAAPLSVHDILGSYGFDDNARGELKKQGWYVDGDGVMTLHKDGTFTSTGPLAIRSGGPTGFILTEVIGRDVEAGRWRLTTNASDMPMISLESPAKKKGACSTWGTLYLESSKTGYLLRLNIDPDLGPIVLPRVGTGSNAPGL